MADRDARIEGARSGARDLIAAVLIEYGEAVVEHGHFHSLHEGYAVLAEEVDELWEIVRQKRSARSPLQIQNECVQIAAVALKIARSFGVQT